MAPTPAWKDLAPKRRRAPDNVLGMKDGPVAISTAGGHYHLILGFTVMPIPMCECQVTSCKDHGLEHCMAEFVRPKMESRAQLIRKFSGGRGLTEPQYYTESSG